MYILYIHKLTIVTCKSTTAARKSEQLLSATHKRQFFHQLKILKNNFYIHIYPETKYFVMTKRF